MEFLNFSDPDAVAEYEAFMKSSPLGNFMQSIEWSRVKRGYGWRCEAVLSRNFDETLAGTVLVLIKKFPFPLKSFLYAPWGPVCDLRNETVLRDLLSGVWKLAGKYRAWLFKACPLVEEDDGETIEILKQAGLSHTPCLPDTKIIQCRNNYILPIRGRSAEEIFASFKSKWRYNIRLAKKKGVTCGIYGADRLNDFYRLLQETSLRDGFTIRSKEYFATMLEKLGEHCRLYLCYYNGQALSGAVTVQYGGRTCYVYGASTALHREVMPNYLMQWEMIQWAVESGCHTYDFMGIPHWYDETHPNYGVYRFKQGFNGRVAVYAGEFSIVFSPGYKRMMDRLLHRAHYEKLT